jgi:hypothetical protein
MITMSFISIGRFLSGAALVVCADYPHTHAACAAIRLD